jgi:hypothetical protein
MTTPSMGSRKPGGSKGSGTASTIRKIFGSSSQRKVSQSKQISKQSFLSLSLSVL